MIPRCYATGRSPFAARRLAVGCSGCLLVAILAIAPARATSYVMTTDVELLERSELVVVATIESIETAPSFRQQPATDHLIQIERVLKGFVGGGSILVRMPGGLRGDGTALHVFGIDIVVPFHLGFDKVTNTLV